MITAQDYDDRIIAGGIQHLIDTYYAPVSLVEKRRIAIVMMAISPAPGETILDVGCGAGTFAFHCAKAGARTFGIDYSPESIRAAVSLCSRFGVADRTEFRVGDATALPYESDCFDKVVAADFIEHVTLREKELLAKEMYRVLRPGGAAVVFTPNGIREGIGAGYWRVRHLFFRDRIPATELHYGLTTRYEFEAICTKSGFRSRFRYEDVTRPILARLPLARHALALNLLWVLRKP
jgi:SAM-dependent methyltransferase